VKRALGFLARAMLGVLVLVLLVLLLRNLEWRRVLELLRAAALLPVALAVVLGLTVNTYARARRRALLLAAVPRGGPAVGLGEMTALLLASFAANNLLPARAGDVLFALQLNKRHGCALSSVAAAQVVEKVVEVISLWLLAPPTLLLIPRAPAALATALYAFVAVGAVGMATIAWALRAGTGRDAVDPARPRPLIATSVARWVDAMRGLLTPRTWWRALAWSTVVDAADLSMVWLCADAVGLHASLGTALCVYLAVNLAIAVPSSPGQVGFLEAGAVLALVGLGVGESRALAVALLYHAVHLVPVTLVGSVVLLRLRWRRAAAPAPTGETKDAPESV